MSNGIISDLMFPSVQEIPLAPQIVRAEDGRTFRAGPESVRFILTNKQTGGAFLLLEATIDAPSYGPPMHIHTREDETFSVLEGQLIVIVDGVRHELNPGDVAFAPRGIPHRFESGPYGARFTVMTNGDNFERFFPRFLEAAGRGDFPALPGIAAEHGIELLPQG